MKSSINLSSGNPSITWAVKRPQGGGEDLLTCNIVTGEASNGIIEIPITTSVTEFAGDAYGEIRVTTSGTTIKFFGINACIGEGVSNEAAAQSSRFDALLDALQQVVVLNNNTDKVAKMDSLDSNGDLKTGVNGTNPISSDNLNTYLKNKFQEYLLSDGGFGNGLVGLQYAHAAHSSGYTEQNPIDTYSDGGVYIDDAIDNKVLYLYKNSNENVHGILLCASRGVNQDGAVLQLLIERVDGVMQRTGGIPINGSRIWSDWYRVESRQYMDTDEGGTLHDSDNYYPSSKLVATKIAEAILAKADKTTTVAGHALSSNVSADDIVRALVNTGKSIYLHTDSVGPFGSQKYVDVPVPAIWVSGNYAYLVLSRVAGTPSPTYGIPYTYSGLTLPRFKSVSQWDTFNPATTSGAQGEIVVGSTNNGVWICNGGTQWVQIAKTTDLDNVKTKKATATLDSTLWLNGMQALDVSSVYTLTEDTKVDIEIDFTTFNILQSSGCYGIYLETETSNNTTTLTAKVMGSVPSSDVDIQLIFSEIDDLGEIGGGGNE